MRVATIAAALIAALAAGCRHDLPELPPSMIPEPAAADVETVIFLVGDAGNATERNYPIVHVLRADVEAWAERLRSDTAVIVLYLGDIIYPDGMSAPGTADYEWDSLVVAAQVNAVAGAAARERVWAYFLAGNHDWGNARDAEGVDNLQELEQFLDRQRAAGPRVRLLPEAGEPGPVVLDVGRQLTLLLYDTAWWLLASDQARKLDMMRETEAALRSARRRNRTVVMAAHHPWQSASAHGGFVRFWDGFGVRYLLSRSGAILQDLNSIPYRELRMMLQETFAAGPPLVFVGGHDHTLQVIQNQGSNEPLWSIVSGSASKVSEVGHMAGMRYRLDGPGYGKIFIRRDGHVDFIMVAAPNDDQLMCEGAGTALQECMSKHMTSFIPRYGVRLK